MKGFDPVALLGVRDARKFDRYAQLAIAAAQEAQTESGLVIDDSNRDRVGILIGTGIGGIITLMENFDTLHEQRPPTCESFPCPDDDRRSARRACLRFARARADRIWRLHPLAQPGQMLWVRRQK